MPERWERELGKLHGVEMQERAVRDRIRRGPNVDRWPPRRNRLVAGVVAAAVASAAIAFLWKVIPDEEGRDIDGPLGDFPTLLVTFTRDGTIGDGSGDPPERIETTISYGDATEESFTSTTPQGAHVDWVTVEDLTPLVPGPTIGSHIDFGTDGENARVLIGEPPDWPEFERFTPVDVLPEQPGEYVLIFEADYPNGVARTARFVRIVSPGMLQLVITEGKSLYAATALAYLDGSRTVGHLSSSWFTLGDVGAQSDPVAPSFGSDAWIDLPPGTPMLLASVATHARAGLLASYSDLDLNDRLPIDLLGETSVIDGPEGRHLLAIDVTWRHGPHPLRAEETKERALFLFPIEIAIAPQASNIAEPTPAPSASPSVDSPAATSDVLRVRCGPEGIDVLTPIVTAQADGLHVVPIDVPPGWSMAVTSSGDENVVMLSGSDGVDNSFVRPLPPGDAVVMCGVRGILDSEPERFQDSGVPFRLVDPSGYFMPYGPQCNDSDLVPFYRRMDGVDSDAADRIRNDIPGVRALDIVERAGYRVDNGGRYWWRVVREGSVVAGLQVGPQGGGVIHGWVCGSSGIDPGGPSP